MRVLLVEDNEQLGQAVREQVRSDGHAIDWMTNLGDAIASIRVVDYDLVLLDMMLPDGNGLGFLAHSGKLKKSPPVIIITAMDQISDRIAGLNAGADDYLVKPFDLTELSARIAAVSRRYAGNPRPRMVIGDLEVDINARTVRRGKETIDLTPREWALLEILAQRPDVTHSKTRLEECLYAFDSEVESNTVEVHISRLRKKIGRDLIQTVRGFGYRIPKDIIS